MKICKQVCEVREEAVSEEVRGEAAKVHTRDWGKSASRLKLAADNTRLDE